MLCCVYNASDATGEPYSHAGLVVVDEEEHTSGQRVVLAYEATNNKSGTPDIMAGTFAERPHIFPIYEGVWGFEFFRRVLSYKGNVLLARLQDPERTRSQHAAVAQFAKHTHVYSSGYDKIQFGTATVQALTRKVNLTDKVRS